MKVVTEIEIPDQHIEDTLDAAFAGGIAGWCPKGKVTKMPRKKRGKPPLRYWPEIIMAGGEVTLEHDDASSRGKPAHVTSVLSRAACERGLKLLAKSKDYAHHWTNMLQENGDAETGSVFLQFCIFGDVIFS